jgi:Repeat of unknown function (DUF5648)
MRASYAAVCTVLVTQVALGQATTAVEYHHAAWNHYFVTALPTEIAGLDAGAFDGAWQRTGQTFRVLERAAGAAQPTCRFFSTAIVARSTHFYTPIAGECTAIKANPAWRFEGIAFYVDLPAADGQCAAGLVPLYRAYNGGSGGAPNHRYTTSVVTLAAMGAAGWVAEGHRATRAFACVQPTLAPGSGTSAIALRPFDFEVTP